MAQICINNLTFHYDGSYDDIFTNVSFKLDTDWRLGFIGRNGRGKTTFLNLLVGRYEYQGNIKTPVPVDYFPYEPEEKIKKKNTIEVIEAIYPDYELWKVCREFTFLGMDGELLYRPFHTLSYGEQTKVMLAVLFSKDNRFLLIDEPTNHLDMPVREMITDYLNKKKGFILVSHDRWFLDSCIDHVLVINKNNIEVLQGNFSSWWENKKRQDEYETSENERLKKEISRLSKAAKRNENWSNQAEGTKIGMGIYDRGYVGHKAAKMMKRAKATEQRAEKSLEEKSKLLKNVEKSENLKIVPLKHHKEILVKAKDLSLFYGERAVVRNLDFEVRHGECVAFQGKNGCGKSSILKKILGENIKSSGILEAASGLKVSYVSQDTSHLKGSLENFIKIHQINEPLFKALLRKLDFERVQFEKKLEDYSGGQKKKVLIAKSLAEQAHLYIWDEPLNFIDIFSRIQIEELIRQFRPTLLLVEHDRSFIEKTANKRIIL